jgi:hypothetical protein
MVKPHGMRKLLIIRYNEERPLCLRKPRMMKMVPTRQIPHLVKELLPWSAGGFGVAVLLMISMACRFSEAAVPAIQRGPQAVTIAPHRPPEV